MKQIATLACGLTLIALPAAFAGSQDLASKFKLIDMDGDGRVSAAEHTAGARQMFLNADSNGDGILTVAELAISRNSQADSTALDTSSTRGNPLAAEWKATDKIREIDQNGDGKLTVAEHQAGTAALFARLDSNGDGYLTQDELAESNLKRTTR